MKSAYSLAFVLALAAPGTAGYFGGRWDATIQFDDYKISFPIEFSGEGSHIRASFNGDERVNSTAGNFDGNTLSVRFEHYATQLDATITDGLLKGTYGSKRNGFHAIEAARVLSVGVAAILLLAATTAIMMAHFSRII